MLTIEKSKEILNRDGLNYTDEQVKQIREFIYILAEIDYRLWERKHQEKDGQFQNENNTEVKEINLIEVEKQKEKNNKAKNDNKTENYKPKQSTDETQSHSIHPREYGRAS